MKQPLPNARFGVGWILSLAAVTAMIGMGCAAGTGMTTDRFAPTRPIAKRTEPDRFGISYMAFALRNNLRDPDVITTPLIVTSFVDLNNLNQSSVLGRLLAEKLIDELHLNGFEVSEIRKANNLFVREKVGEMILSRNANELLKTSDARAILVGTYVATGRALMVNCRLIDLHSPRILSSCSYELTMTTELEALLSGEEFF